MIRAVGRAQIEKFVEIVQHPGFPEHGGRNHSYARVADRKPVRTSGSVDVIGGLAASPAGHILADEGRVPRSVFLQERDHSSYPHISCAAGIPALNDADGFSLIKGRLREKTFGWIDKTDEQDGKKQRRRKSTLP
jgi:hypothetical protein